MSRYIDADALFAELENVDWYNNADRDEIAEWLVLQAPTIDAVSVVRCKDCVDMFHDDWYKCFACANLYGLNEEVKPDDYCSHGERKEKCNE